MKSTKTIKLLAILFIVSYILNACSNKDGRWDDNIELSQKEVHFNSSADSTIITTKGEGWWISNIRLNDQLINFDSITTTDHIFDIIKEEFILSRKNTRELHIKVNENPTDEQRELLIGVQAGNYFDNIKVLQKGK